MDSIPMNALNPMRWERIEGNEDSFDEGRFYIGSHLAGTIVGSRETGYIAYPTNRNCHFWSDNLTKTIRRLRTVWWADLI